MSRRIFWDAMLFIYLLEGVDSRTERFNHLLQLSHDRGDSLFTSHLAFGEVLAGARRVGGPEHLERVKEKIPALGFTLLPFGAGSGEIFGDLRGIHKVKVADSINLACAATAGIDFFLTADKKLARLSVPGIQFIVDTDTFLLLGV